MAPLPSSTLVSVTPAEETEAQETITADHQLIHHNKPKTLNLTSIHKGKERRM